MVGSFEMLVGTHGTTRDYRLRDSSLNLQEGENFRSHHFLNQFKMSRQGNFANFGLVNTNIANECMGYAAAQLVEALRY
jgi:hypothetical protein